MHLDVIFYRITTYIMMLACSTHRSNTVILLLLPYLPSVQSNFNGSDIFGTMEVCSRHGEFEPLRVNHGARSGRKWR